MFSDFPPTGSGGGLLPRPLFSFAFCGTCFSPGRSRRTSTPGPVFSPSSPHQSGPAESLASSPSAPAGPFSLSKPCVRVPAASGSGPSSDSWPFRGPVPNRGRRSFFFICEVQP